MLLKYIRENILARFFFILIFVVGLALKIFLTGEDLFNNLSIQTSFTSINFSGENLLLYKSIILILFILHAALGAFVLKRYGLFRLFSVPFSFLLALGLLLPINSATLGSLCMAIVYVSAIAILLSINIKQNTVAKFFNASFLIGLIVYAFPIALLLLLGIIFACPILKLNKIKEVLGGIMGFFMAFLFIFLLNYVISGLMSWNPIAFLKSSFSSSRLFPDLSYLVLAVSIWIYFRVFSDKRKYSLSLDTTVPTKLNIILVFFLISLPLFFFMETKVLFIFPAACLFTLYFFKQKETLSKESLFYVFLALLCFLVFH